MYGGCFSAGLSVMGVTCSVLAWFTGFYDSLIVIITALAAPMAMCMIACVIFF